MYLIALIAGFCVAYLALIVLFSYFFEAKLPKLSDFSWRSVVYILVLSLIIFTVTFSIEDRELSNRVMHAFGGGLLSFFICFRVVKDARISISKFNFFIFSFLIVSLMGIANEILEFILQMYFHRVFAVAVEDTWLDLVSNAVGTLIGAVLLMPFYKFHK